MSENIKETIAKNLLFYRKKNKITQKELAEQLGVKHNAISSWENGVNSIDIDTLFRVCEIFGVTVNDMYGVYDDANIKLSYNERQLLERYCELDDDGRETIDYILEKEYNRVVMKKNIPDQLIIDLDNPENIITLKEWMSRNQSENSMLNAAHERTDIQVTDEMRKHDDDIMDNDTF